MKQLTIFVLWIQLSISLAAQENGYSRHLKYHPDSLKQWTTELMDEISKKHPGFYRYTHKSRFDELIDSTRQTIHDSLTELEYYRKLKPLFAQIGCLHTGISLSPVTQSYLDTTTTLIPISVFIHSDGQALISGSYALNEHIPIGAEILSINQRPISVILNTLFGSIPSDGYNQTEKVLLLNHRFPFWYQSMIETSENFEIEILENGKTKTLFLKGITKDKFPQQESLEKNYLKPLEFEIRNGVAVLKIHTFAKSEYNENFKNSVKDIFSKIEKDNIQHLVIDVRNNTGGTDGNAVFLASYFFDQPFRYWEKIEVTEAVAKEIKGMNRLFYRKPTASDSLYEWQSSWITNEFDYYKEQKPAKYTYKGNTYLITNGLCLSSCADFAAILSHHKKAEVIGQETGGGYQGNTSGMMPGMETQTGSYITIPLQKYTNAVDLAKNYGRGTIPDYPVMLTLDDWINKRDIEMEQVMDLISGNKQER